MTPTEPIEYCACGRPIHYTEPETEVFIRRQVSMHGATVQISTANGAWRVPRHYVALHPIVGRQLPELARLHNWPRVR